MVNVKKYDFVEIDYTARIKEDNTIFDTTEEKVAKENGLYDKNAEYLPIVICVGQNHIIKGIEEQLVDKEVGKEYTFEISSDNAFGSKDPKLIQLIPLGRFREQNITPFPGLQLNVDGVFSIVKTVSGGRCLVDFNHPLAGKDLIYDVKLRRLVVDDKEKLRSLVDKHTKFKDYQIELKDGIATISLKDKISNETREILNSTITKLIPSIKSLNFTIGEGKKEINLNR